MKIDCKKPMHYCEIFFNLKMMIKIILFLVIFTLVSSDDIEINKNSVRFNKEQRICYGVFERSLSIEAKSAINENFIVEIGRMGVIVKTMNSIDGEIFIQKDPRREVSDFCIYSEYENIIDISIKMTKLRESLNIFEILSISIFSLWAILILFILPFVSQ